MINIQFCNKKFEEIAARYDTSNPKISLKIKHMYETAKICERIAVNLELNSDEIELAYLIGLLHDVGRFYQLEKYNTYEDNQSINHAEASIKVLFEEDNISLFNCPKEYYDIIRKAIFNHNRFEIEPNLTAEELFFARIIRDADKIDIYRAMTDKNIDEAFFVSENENVISENVRNQFYLQKLINHMDKKSQLDDLVAKLAYVYDFHFNCSKTILKESEYLDKFVWHYINNTKLSEELKIELLAMLNEAKKYI